MKSDEDKQNSMKSYLFIHLLKFEKMKRTTLIVLAMLAFCLSANAQKDKLSEDQRDDAMVNLFQRATLVDGKFAITREPITWYDYWAATGEKAHSPNTSVTHAAIVSDGKKEFMAKCINDYFGETVVRVASPQEIRTAHDRIGLHRELSENSLAGNGFFLSMTPKTYKYFKDKMERGESVKRKNNNRNVSSNNPRGGNVGSNNPRTGRSGGVKPTGEINLKNKGKNNQQTSSRNNDSRTASQKQKDEEYNRILNQLREEEKQKMSVDQSHDIIVNLFLRLKLVDNKFAITKSPITYKEYWGTTYEKAHKSDGDLNKTAVVNASQKSKVVKGLNEFFQGNYFSLATNEQIRQAGLNAGNGFFVVMSAKNYKEFKRQYDENH
jgi:hypothetical protein